MAGKGKRRRIHVSYKGFCCLMLALIILINVLAWVSSSFCDAYVRYIFPIALNTWGRFWGLFPVAAGDIVLFFSLMWVLVLLCMGLMSAFFRGRLWVITKHIARAFFAYLLVILFFLTTNWWLLYHTTSINECIFPAESPYAASDVVRLYNRMAEEANMLAEEVARDAEGNPCSDIDIDSEAVRLMGELSDTFPLLAGFYPQPKQMGLSAFFSQQYISGYYFPITLEANINSLMMEINDPFVTCHELAHLKGYIREDEANCIGILACLRSENAFFRYSGLLAALGYLENAVYTDPASADYALTARMPQTYADDVFLSREAWARVEEQALISTDMLSRISDFLVDSSLKVNGIEDGKKIYSRVVELLLFYCSKEPEKQ